ncbi:uncharacterized protein BX663DRAFT_515343, partial [Cokeromyces recurvatus]|uniref:uncharacterized protein n=1 Tax=Cokeromyces recurvatus TaxID=90255 RepID=UPI00221F72E0
MYKCICAYVSEVENDAVFRTKNVTQLEEEEEADMDTHVEKTSELRKRHIDKEDDTSDEWVKVEKIKKNKPKKNKGDPLHWFGFLVSSSLRTSQEHFKYG